MAMACGEYFKKYRRNVYVTPKSYLGFLGEYPRAGPHGGRPRQRQRHTALPATARPRAPRLILVSAPSSFEATRQPSSGPFKAANLFPNRITGTSLSTWASSST